MTIIGSTLSSNTGSVGAAIIASGTVPVELRDVTIAANTATSPEGGASIFWSELDDRKHVLVENPGGNCGIAGPITASSNNLSSDASCGTAARMATGLTVEGLTDNGGPTRTHSLPVGSPAIDWARAAKRPTSEGSRVPATAMGMESPPVTWAPLRRR